MSYYIWRSDAGLSKQYLYADRVPSGMKHSAWTKGEAMKITPKVEILVGASHSGKELSDMVLTQFQLPIFSPKAIAVLEKLGVKNLEYFPIIITHKKLKTIEKNYKIANVVGLVDCLDKKHAKFETFPEDKNAISWLERYKILENKVPKGSKGLVFRLGEFHSHVLVHGSVKQAWEKEGLTGAEFIPTEKFA